MLLFFQFILPVITHQGQFITVPSLKDIPLEEIEAEAMHLDSPERRRLARARSHAKAERMYA